MTDQEKRDIVSELSALLDDRQPGKNHLRAGYGLLVTILIFVGGQYLEVRDWKAGVDRNLNDRWTATQDYYLMRAWSRDQGLPPPTQQMYDEVRKIAPIDKGRLP